MKTSVVLATYNGEKYIEEQLKTILNQTLKVDEVLIYDDCSKDSTQCIVERFIKDNNLCNWHFKVNENNLGYENNFNKLMYDSTGDLVFLCDQDDIWKIDKVEKTVSFFENNKDVDLLCTDNDFLNTLNSKKIKEIKNMKFNNKIELLNANKKNFHIGRPGCDMIVRREFLMEIKNYWVDKWAQDDFLWRFAYLKGTIALYHFCGITRRLHENNTARKEGITKYRTIEGRSNHLFNDLCNLESALKYFEDNNNDNKKVERVLKKNIKARKIRIKMLRKRNIFLWMLMFFYIGTYPRKKGFILDLIVILKGK